MPSTVHDALPFEAYCALPGENASALREMLISPLAYWWRKHKGREDRDALRVGRATHTAVLEPARFECDYAVFEGARRAGKEWERFQAENEARTLLTRMQRDTAMRIADAVHAHPVADRLLSEEGQAELSIEWVHERTGLACKSRIDLVVSALVDLKTCRDPSPRVFASAAARLGYHMQMAFYSGALASVGVDVPAVIIAAQNVPPWDVVVYEMPDEALVIGEQLYERALDQVVLCTGTGKWPGHAPDAMLPLSLPSWAVPQALDDVDDAGGWAVAVTVGE